MSGVDFLCRSWDGGSIAIRRGFLSSIFDHILRKGHSNFIGITNAQLTHENRLKLAFLLFIVNVKVFNL